MISHDSDSQFGIDLAYTIYKTVYQSYQSLPIKAQRRARRTIESSIRESAGFNGVSTGLISMNALQTIINQKNGIHPTSQTRLATEHPVTHKNVAEYILNDLPELNKEEYFDVWESHLVTTVTTNQENQYLKNFQSEFNIKEDCWKEMYSKAGIELIERPNFRLKSVKEYYGVNQ